jgi:hypothetical protein
MILTWSLNEVHKMNILWEGNVGTSSVCMVHPQLLNVYQFGIRGFTQRTSHMNLTQTLHECLKLVIEKLHINITQGFSNCVSRPGVSNESEGGRYVIKNYLKYKCIQSQFSQVTNP